MADGRLLFEALQTIKSNIRVCTSLNKQADIYKTQNIEQRGQEEETLCNHRMSCLRGQYSPLS